MIRAKLETRHFTFDAYGKTEAEALDVLRRGWDYSHRKNYPDAKPFDDFVQDGDVCFYRVEIGSSYCDGEELLGLTKSHPDAAEILARGFSTILSEWLTPEQMQEAIKKNKTAEAGVCHSHDHCDANMAMDGAFVKLWGQGPADVEDETEKAEYHALWNTAWDIAKTNEFFQVRKTELVSLAKLAELHKMAQDARPLNDDEWGSERQIKAQNAFFEELERVLTREQFGQLEDDNDKATSDEMIDNGLRILGLKAETGESK